MLRTIVPVVIVLALAYWAFYISSPPGDAEAIVQSRPDLMAVPLKPAPGSVRQPAAERR